MKTNYNKHFAKFATESGDILIALHSKILKKRFNVKLDAEVKIGQILLIIRATNELVLSISWQGVQ